MRGAPTVNGQHGKFSILRVYRFGTRVGTDQVRYILEREFRSQGMPCDVCFAYMPVTLVAFDPPA